MLLDKGICSIYSVSNTATAGHTPNKTPELKYQSWYGELSFETSPSRIAGQDGVAVAERIRILQNRSVSSHDVAVIGDEQFVITRAYHGTDAESGERITDLTLERLVQKYALN